MNKSLPLLLLCFISCKLFSQDTIRSQDLPSAGATYALSHGIAFPGMNPSATGVNYNWDFEDLSVSAQTFDTMFVPSTTNPLFSFYFIDNSLNLNRSNFATRGDEMNLGFTGLEDIFHYWYNSATEFRQPGFGAVVNSIAIPVDYIPNDVLYRFPLKYADKDSVSYEYHIDLSTTIGIYYEVIRKRHNFVDGWGTLKTPFGTFDVVRVKSTLVQQDSTYIVPLNSGVKTPPVTTFEYKWLGKNYGQPLLQINTSANNNVNKILYQDSLRNIGINEVVSIIDEPQIFPNPADEFLVIKYHLNKKAKVNISLVSLDGKEIMLMSDEIQSSGLNIKSIILSDYKLQSGNYLVKISSGKTIVAKQVIIEKD